MEVASLYATLRLDDAQYKQGLRNARTQIDGATSSVNQMTTASSGLSTALKGIGAMAAVAFAATAIREAAASLVDTTAQMEAYRMRLRAVIDEQVEADATFQRIKNWAAINPVNTDEAVASFVLLKAAAVDNTEAAVKAVGNLSAVMGRDMRDTATALVSINTMQLRRLGIILDQTGDKAVLRIGKTRMEVEKDVDAMRAAMIELITQNYGSAMDKANNTFKGIMNTWGGQLQNFRTDLMGLDDGGPFRNLVKSIKEASAAFGEWQKSESYRATISSFQHIANTAIDAGKAVLSVSGNLITSDIGSTVLKWGVGLKVANMGIKGLVGAGSGLIGILKGIGTEFNTGLTVAGAAANGFQKMGKSVAIMNATMAMAPTKMAGLSLGLRGIASLVSPTGAIIAGLSAMSFLLYDSYSKHEEFMRLSREKDSEAWNNYFKYLEEQIVVKRRAATEELARIEEEQRKAREAAIKPQDRIFHVTMGLWRSAEEETRKAKTLIEQFGLDAKKVYADVATHVKDANKEALEALSKSVGPAGLAAVAQQLGEIAKRHPDMKPIAEALGHIGEEALDAKKRIGDLGSEMDGLINPLSKVLKTMQKGLFPAETFGEVQRYLQESWTKYSGNLKESLSLEFQGLSGKAQDAIFRHLTEETAKGLGMVKVSGAAQRWGTLGERIGERSASRETAFVELSDATLTRLGKRAPVMNVTIHQQGLVVKSETEARRLGMDVAKGMRLGLAGAQ